jgi:protein dithiol oxidoreductase (disulfide-forming)
MKRILTVFSTVLVFSLFSMSFVSAEIRPLKEGDDYEVMGPKGTKKPEIMEFFSYGCGACYNMESLATEFKKNNPGIKFSPVPIDLGHAQWKIYIKAFYLGELLKVLDKSHSKMFHLIHVERKQIVNDGELKAFFVKLGVDPIKFDKAIKSFALDAKMRRAKQLAKTYRISSTPTFVANQRFKLNNRSLNSTDMINKALLELSNTSL